MGEFGVPCRMSDGEDVLVTVDAADAEMAVRQVRRHIRLFSGAERAVGDRALTATLGTITGAPRPLADFDREPAS